MDISVFSQCAFYCIQHFYEEHRTYEEYGVYEEYKGEGEADYDQEEDSDPGIPGVVHNIACSMQC